MMLLGLALSFARCLDVLDLEHEVLQTGELCGLASVHADSPRHRLRGSVDGPDERKDMRIVESGKGMITNSGRCLCGITEMPEGMMKEVADLRLRNIINYLSDETNLTNRGTGLAFSD